MRKRSVIFCYGLGYCARNGSLYVDGVKVVDDLRSGYNDLLVSLGYHDIKEVRADQDWCDDIGWIFPDKFDDVIMAK